MLKDLIIKSSQEPLLHPFLFHNFIKPLQKESLIENLFIVDSTYSLDNIEKQAVNSKGYILDIDLDFFSEDMDYIDRKRKIEVINNLAKKAALITICTSPFFIDFNCSFFISVYGSPEISAISVLKNT